MDAHEDWTIRFVPLSRPQLLVAQDAKHPELPSVPTPQLVLSDSPTLKGYYGEEFYGVIIATHKHSADPGASDQEASLPERVHLKAKLHSVDGSVRSYPSKSHEISTGQIQVLNPISFQMNYPGRWQLKATLQVEHQLETQSITKTFDIDVKPAVSIRFKISRGSANLRAHVLEAQVENLADSVLSIESCELSPKNGWTAEAIRGVNPGPGTLSETAPTVLLRPHEVFQYSFILRGGSAAEAAALILGWRREPLGAKGWQTTASVRI